MEACWVFNYKLIAVHIKKQIEILGFLEEIEPFYRILPYYLLRSFKGVERMARKRLYVIGAFLLVSVIGTTVFASSSDPGSTGDPLVTKSYVDTIVNNKVSGLQSQLTAATTKINSLQTQLTAATTKVNSLQSQLGTANTKITALEARVKSLESKVGSTPTPTPTYKTGTVTVTSLNVRSGPGTSYRLVGSLKYGTSVTIISSKAVSGATWHQIKSGSISGWVHGAYIRIR